MEFERDLQDRNRLEWLLMVFKTGTVEEIRATYDRLYGDRKAK